MRREMRIMQQLIRIREIKERADRIGLSMRELAAITTRHPATVYRWLKADANPHLKDYDDACRAMEAALVERERSVLAALTGAHSSDPETRHDRP